MFKNQSPECNQTSPTAGQRQPGSELPALTDRLEQNVAEAVKTISEAEQNLDVSSLNEGKAPLHQDDTSSKIVKVLELLKSLETDAADVIYIKHPHAEETEKCLKHLHERAMKIHMEFEKVYKLTPSESFNGVNWENAIEKMWEILSNKRFGLDLPSVESQVEEHSMFHTEVEALGAHMADPDDKYELGDLRMKHSELLARSEQRRRDLLSLRDYMLRCTVELYWMEEQIDDRVNYDWSDANLDYPSRQKQHEKITSKYLECKEATITQLCDDGERLLAANHPGSNVVQAHVEAIRADWKNYRRLLFCEKHHLRHMDDYHKYYKEVLDTQDRMTRLATNLNHKYNPEFKDMYQIQGMISDLDDLMGEVDQLDEQVKAIQRCGQQVFPLKLRGETLQKHLLVEALCDFDTEEGKISEGRYNLLTNNGVNWEVKGATEGKCSAPAVCFVIPPPDTEAISFSENLMNQQKTTKQTLFRKKDELQKRLEGLRKESPTVAASQDQLCLQLMASLEKVTNDLEKQEKAIYTCVRPPLQANNASQDSSARLQALKDIEALVKKIEPEKNSKVHAAETFLNSHPKCLASAQLFTKVNKAEDEYSKVSVLLECIKDKFLNSSKLEHSLEAARTLLSTYETTLAYEDAAPSDLSCIERLQENLFKISPELQFQRIGISEAQENLGALRSSCEKMTRKVQEHCPDIERQQTEIHKLRKRLEIISRQVDARSKSLQRAKAAYNNYDNSYNDLNEWLSQLPNHGPQDTDDVQQINAKLQKQRDLLLDVTRKEYDLHNVIKNAQLYQQAVQDYETETEQFKSILDFEDGLLRQTRNRRESPARKVKNEESVIEAKFMEVIAVNKQRLQNLEYVQSLFNQNVVMVQRPWKLKMHVEDETEWRKRLEQEIKAVQNDIRLLEEEKPQNVVVEKELIKKVLDPQLEEELCRSQQELCEGQRVTGDLRNKLELLHCKLHRLEAEKQGEAQQYMVKEVLRIERDREQEETLRRLRDELAELHRRRTATENEIAKLQTQFHTVMDGQPKARAVIMEEEVQAISDPELEYKYRELLESKHVAIKHRIELEEELKLLQQKLKQLEDKGRCEENISVQNWQTFGKDVELKRKIEELKAQYEDEKAKHMSLSKHNEDLQREISALEIDNTKGVFQEDTNEIWHDRKARNEVANLHNDLAEQQRKCEDLEVEIRAVRDELKMLRTRNPQIESNETIKEVIRFKTDPEIEMELERLRNRIAERNCEMEKADKEMTRLKDEIQRWKAAKSQVETKEVTKIVIQYREDPETKQEVETLKKKIAEEQQKCLDLENERSAIEEKLHSRKCYLLQIQDVVIQQEIVKAREDALLPSDHVALSQDISSDLKLKKSLRDEPNNLHSQKSDMGSQLEELEWERTARQQVEIELLRLKVQLSDLEAKETTEKGMIKQNMAIQQGPLQENEYSSLRAQFEQERNRRMLLEKAINAARHRQATLVKMAAPEKVHLSERIQVERDTETERLKRTLEEETNRCEELNQQLTNIKSKLSHTEFTSDKFTEELQLLENENDQLQMENRRLKNEIRKLNSDIQVTAEETERIANLSPLQKRGNTERILVSLQKELSDLKNINNEKDKEIKKLQTCLSAATVTKEQRESHLRRSIMIIEPDTCNELKPEQAYNRGLIDWALLVKLENQECDWEEISIKGAYGESSVLHDKKSGKHFSIEDELNAGNITSHQLQQFYNNEISIQEFGTMLSSRAVSKPREK